MDNSKEAINNAKQQFANNFPLSGNDDNKKKEDCARYAMNAATNRAHLYSPNTNHQGIRDFWKEKLIEIGEKYKKEQTLEIFIKDIEAIKETMNKQYPDSFKNGKKDYDNGFRIAHAQKSLSIYLKHLWCNDLIKVLPPVCPIDGIVLKMCGSNESWTKVNSVKEYKKHIETVEKKRNEDGFSSLPEWEVCAFNNRNSSSPKKL